MYQSALPAIAISVCQHGFHNAHRKPDSGRHRKPGLKRSVATQKTLIHAYFAATGMRDRVLDQIFQQTRVVGCQNYFKELEAAGHVSIPFGV